MKIAHVLDHYQPKVGYQETFLAEKQRGLGHEVRVFTSPYYFPWLTAAQIELYAGLGFGQENEVSVYRLPIWFQAPTGSGIVMFRNLKSPLLEFKPDVVHVHAHSPFMIVVYQIARLKDIVGFNLVMDSHLSIYNAFINDNSRHKVRLKQLLHGIFRHVFGRYIVRQMDAMIAIGEPERDFYDYLFGPEHPDVNVIPLGADSEAFDYDLAGQDEIRRSLGWTSDDIVIGHAGIMWEEKGIAAILEACDRLRTEHTQLKILLIGSVREDYQETLDNLARDLGLDDVIVVTGFVDHDQLPVYLSTLDIGIWSRAISISAIEAMACHTPIIANRTSYTEMLIEDTEAGILIEDSTGDSVYDALKSLLENSELITQLRRNARQAVEQRFNWTAISQEFISLYQSVIEDSY